MIERVNRRGFTLIELIAVIVVLAILAGVALPKYFDYSTQAKASSCKGTLGGARAAIANFYANQALTTGTPADPTYVQFTTLGTVMQEPLPDNPYTSPTVNTVRDADGTWVAGAPPVSGAQGWAYDETNGKFWANTDTAGVDENEF